MTFATVNQGNVCEAILACWLSPGFNINWSLRLMWCSVNSSTSASVKPMGLAQKLPNNRLSLGYPPPPQHHGSWLNLGFLPWFWHSTRQVT
eukprot:g74355.t1